MTHAAPVTPASSRPKNLPSLTGMRWFAALAVFGVHVGVTTPEAAVNVAHAGVLGVCFFFVLSGFVLAWSATQDDSPLRFYGRRFARIYPLYVVTFLIAGALLLMDGGRLGVLRFTLGLTGLQAWVPDYTIFLGINGPAWSISAEAFFYLLFPVVFLLVRRAGKRQVAVAALILLALISAVCIGALVNSTAAAIGNDRGFWGWFPYIFPPTRFLEFTFGCLAARAVQLGIGRRLSLLPVTAAVLALYFVVAFALKLASGVGSFIMVAPFAALLVAGADADLRRVPTVFSSAPVVRLGQWSFAFYLIHTQVISSVNLWKKHFGIDPAIDRFLVLAPLELLLSIAAAAALHYAVERPYERRLRAQLSGSRSLPVSG